MSENHVNIDTVNNLLSGGTKEYEVRRFIVNCGRIDLLILNDLKQ